MLARQNRGEISRKSNQPIEGQEMNRVFRNNRGLPNLDVRERSLIVYICHFLSLSR